MRDNLRFLTTFMRHPVTTGAIAPSSRALAEHMADDMGIEHADTVVELGPGTGAFTRVIETRLRPEALYLALELDRGFAGTLARRFHRVEIINDSAVNLVEHLESRGRGHADAVICGLPWAVFPPELQEAILSAVVRGLRPGGRFATFAYVHAAWFPMARQFHRRLASRFGKVTRTPVVWRNVPPAFIYRCER